MHFEEQGDPRNPTLFCIPGLFGGPTDFAAMRGRWISKFHVITLDPDHVRRKTATTHLPLEDGELFTSTSDQITEILERYQKNEAFLVGVSLGSKVVFDFASKYPKKFAGGLSLDVGCGAFEETDLYGFLDVLIRGLDLNIPFPEMKKHLQEIVPDRNLRTMIQTQIFYPNGKPPARWKAGMSHLGKVLSETMKRQKIDVQFEGMERVDQYLFENNRFIHVLRATTISAICEESLPRMGALRSVKMSVIDPSSHFLHVTHKDLVADMVLKMPEAASRRQHVESEDSFVASPAI